MRAAGMGWSILLAGVICISLLPLGGCDDDEKSSVGPQPGPGPFPTVPPPTSPENLIEALQVIYNDQVRSAAERLQAYQNLFAPADHDSLPGFIYRFHVGGVGQQVWGLDSELQAHDNMFQAQANRDVLSLELSIQYELGTPLEFPEPGHENWQVIFATSVYLRLMFNPQDGLLVDRAQATFQCAPADGRWYICDWEDLPRPFAPGYNAAVEEVTWGSIKALFD